MKVLIVDDEVVIRVGLKSLIDWDEHGFTLVGEAKDGKKALEAIVELKPDIVITDIKMPVMNGIELIRQLSGMENAPRVIVLSSYNDFPLVKEAMRLGAADYLLKLEMTPEILLAGLNELRRELSSAMKPEDQQRLFQTHIRKNIHVLKQKLFKDMLNFPMSEEEWRQTAVLYDIDLHLDAVVCFVIRIASAYDRAFLDDKDAALLNYAAINIVEEMLNDVCAGHCFEIRPNELCAVVFTQEQEQRPALAEVLETIIEMLKKYLNLDTVIGSGQWRQGIEGLKQSYREARQALDIGVSSSMKVVVSREGIPQHSSDNAAYTIFKHKDSWMEALQFCQTERLDSLFANLAETLSNRSLRLENQINVCLELHFLLSDFFAKNDLPLPDILDHAYRTPQQLLQTASFRHLLDWLEQVRVSLVSYMLMANSKGGSRAVVKARKYIDEYYMENLSLKEVAHEVNLTPFYLSHLFIQHAGTTFTEYLTQVRIGRGKELLRLTDFKIYEIGEMVGYRNTTYFNKIFKKTTGMTPIEFRNKSVEPSSP